MATVEQNLRDIRERLAAAAGAGGHKTPPEIIAVTKGHPRDAVIEALEAGHRVFGENRVQEALEKYAGLKDAYPDLELHLIGPLQTNKAKQAVPFFDVIQTLDRGKLAKEIRKVMEKEDCRPNLFIQVNTGEEPQKAGIPPHQLPGFLEQCRGEFGLEVSGLMCIPPFDEEPAMHFALLHKLAQRHGLEGLSMGMSGDYETAAALGATHVRIGTAIFGPRS